MKKFLIGLITVALSIGMTAAVFAQGDVASTHADDLVFKERITGNGAQFIFGTDGDGLDVKIFSETVGDYWLFDESAEIFYLIGVGMDLDDSSLHFGDSDVIYFGDDDDFGVSADANSLNIIPNTDDTGTLEIGSSTKALDFKAFGTGSEYILLDASAHELQFSGVDIDLADNDIINFGADNDFTITYDTNSLNVVPNTDDTGTIELGSSTKAVDTKWFDTGSGYVLLNAGDAEVLIDAVDIQLGDSDYILFGDDTAGDAKVAWDGDSLNVTANTDDSVVVEFGANAICIDLKWFDTAAGYVEADAGNAILRLEQVDLELGDSDYILFGDDAAGDYTITFDADSLNVVPNTDDTGIVEIGSSTKATDMKWFDTGSGYVLFEAGAAQVLLDAVDIKLGDSDYINLGDDSDYSVSADADSLNIVPNTDDTGQIELGSSTKAVDVKAFGTGAEYLLINAGAHELQTSGFDIDIADSDYINFGDGNDFTVQYDTTNIVVLPNTDDTGAIILGSDTKAFDVNWYGVTATAILALDAASDQIQITDLSVLLGEDDAIYFNDTDVSIQAADDGHLDLAADVSIDLNGDVTCSGHVNSTKFFVNAFQYPTPATEWGPELSGAGLPDGQTAKVVWLPLNFLKEGDEIVSYTLVGDVTEASTASVDAQIYKIVKADPPTTTAITGGAMTQVTADGNFDVLTTLTAPEMVATDNQYVIQITGTTTSSDGIVVMGAEVVINRKP